MNKEQPVWMPTEADHEALHTECEEWVSMRYHQAAARQTTRKVVAWGYEDCDNPEHENPYSAVNPWKRFECPDCMRQLRQQVGPSPESEER